MTRSPFRPLFYDLSRSEPGARFPAAHAFCTRHLGNSRGPFASLNLSFAVGDAPSAVEANWSVVRDTFPQVRHWVRMYQVHGNTVRVVRTERSDVIGPCDAIVTELPFVALCVLTADCVPILLSAADGRVVAAAHAGWRGTVAGLAGHVVRCIVEEFSLTPREISAVIGPAIGACCYDVGEDVVEAVERADLRHVGLRLGEGGRVYLDLAKLNRALLLRAGVPESQVWQVDLCTSCRFEEFFSYRRSRGQTGRQLSWVARVIP